MIKFAKQVLLTILLVATVILGIGETPLDFPWYLDLARAVVALICLGFACLLIDWSEYK